jgi:hypothetical protein
MDLSKLSDESRLLVGALVEENHILRNELNDRTARLVSENEETRVSLNNLTQSFMAFQQVFHRLYAENKHLRRQQLETSNQLLKQKTYMEGLQDPSAAPLQFSTTDCCSLCLQKGVGDPSTPSAALNSYLDVKLCQLCTLIIDQEFLEKDLAMTYYGLVEANLSGTQSLTSSQGVELISRSVAEQMCIKLHGSLSNHLRKHYSEPTPKTTTGSSVGTDAVAIGQGQGQLRNVSKVPKGGVKVESVYDDDKEEVVESKKGDNDAEAKGPTKKRKRGKGSGN